MTTKNKLPRIKAALIDMDGVLYDSMPMHANAWKRFADYLGVEASKEEFYLYEGMTGVAIVNMLQRRKDGTELPREQAQDLYNRTKAQYFIEQGQPAIMAGAQAMTAKLREMGVTRVLVTGSAQRSMIERLDRDYPDVFDADKKVTAADVRHGKPNPEPYLMAMKKAGVSAEECIVIENAPLGVQAGKAAGAFVVAVTTGPVPESEMLKSGADVIYKSMPEFAEGVEALINRLNSEE